MSAIDAITIALRSAIEHQNNADRHARLAAEAVKRFREDLQREMTANSIKTIDSRGIKATIRNKRYTNVVDEIALRQHISSLDRDYDFTIVKFDLAKAKREGAKEYWPGLEIEERSELVVTAEKGDE